jgi:hypothetical protein
MRETDQIRYSEVTKFIHDRIELYSELNNKNYELSMYDVFDEIAADLEHHWEDKNNSSPQPKIVNRIISKMFGPQYK